MSSSKPDAYKELSEKKHAHRFTLRTGKQVLSSPNEATEDGSHRHDVHGEITSSADGDAGHTHDIFMDGVTLTSGPSVWPPELGFHQEEVIDKSMMPDLIDPTHTYVFKTGEYGIYDYWYQDMGGNYWKYSNAPEDHADFDQKSGIPLLDKNQPLPHTAPQFFTPEGRRRSTAVPDGVQPEVNPSYNPENPKNVWYEMYKDPANGVSRYTYLDSDVRENPDLWVQYMLRVVDAGLLEYRQFATKMFSEKQHPKDRIVGALLMLVEQGLYEVEELADALVSDVSFTDENVKLLGRKLVCDIPFYDFMTSLVAGREPTDPLFVVDTHHGRNAFGYHYLFSVFKFLRMSPRHIMSWRASHMFSRVMNRMAMTSDVDPDEVEGLALSELQRMFSTTENVKYLVDFKVRETLLQNYGTSLDKALARAESDDYGVLTIFSDLEDLRGDEAAFSEWLHVEPLHDISPAEEVMLEAQLESMQEAKQPEEEEAPEEGSEEGSDEPKEDTGTAGAGAGSSPAPAEGGA